MVSDWVPLLLSIGVAVCTLLLVVPVGRALALRYAIRRHTQRFVGDGRTGVERENRGASSPRLDSLASTLAAITRRRRLGFVFVAAAVVLFAGGAALGGWLVGGLLAVGSVVGGTWLVRRQQARRRDLLEAQLVPALRMMAAATESGYSIRLALDRMVRDLPSPIADEFAQVLHAVDLGVSLEEAVTELAVRVGSENFEFLATMIAVQHRIGGTLSPLLIDLAASVQERLQFQVAVQALTAQARYSAWVLGALPFVVLAFMAFGSPQYIAPLFETQGGQALLFFAAALLAVGLFSIRAISRVDL
jgi:Flp pilus assembly protein TadB